MKDKKSFNFSNQEELGKYFGVEKKNIGNEKIVNRYSDLKIKNNTNGNKYSVEYLIPDDTKKILQENGSEIDNFNLKFNKYVRYQKDQNDKYSFILYKHGKKPEENYDITKDLKFDKSFIDSINKRNRKIIENIGIVTKHFVFTPDWRFIVGLGSSSVCETSITLHHIYGIPYIPGHAIKGVIRNYIINNCFEKNENGEIDFERAEKRAMNDEGFRSIFGSEDEKGKVIFFDAFPIEQPNIKPDIMNPHYGPYYNEGRPPGDYYNPIPIFFLTVEGTKFSFLIGVKNKHNKEISLNKKTGNILEVTSDYLKKALEEHGIGAKTSVGYGYGSIKE